MPNKLIRVAMAAVFVAACGMAGAARADDASPPPTTSAPQAPAAPAAAPPAPSAPAAAPPAATAPAPSAPAPPPGAAAAPEPGKPGDAQAPQGDSTGEVVDLTARPFAYVEGKADKDEIFSSITASLATAKAAADKAGLKIAGKPLAVFLQSDETGFTYRAGYPLESAEGKTSLSDTVKLGETPAGKAMRFQHAGAYADIDATYDAITAYLDEKGIDAEDSFIEEYQNDVKDGDDPSLQVNIYVLTK